MQALEAGQAHQPLDPLSGAPQAVTEAVLYGEDRLGSDEHRINRAVEQDAVLQGALTLDDTDTWGWNTHENLGVDMKSVLSQGTPPNELYKHIPQGAVGVAQLKRNTIELACSSDHTLGLP